MRTHVTSHDTDGKATHLHYQVLGPLAAFDGTEPLELGGHKQRLVLAILLANVNAVVAQDTLIDAVWPQGPSPGGSRTLHTYISTLRRALGNETLTRRGEGYVLTADRSDVDALRFRKLVGEARPLVDSQSGLASELLEQALSLWSGPPYGDLGAETALAIDSAKLLEERVTAQEMRFEADLGCGRHEALVPEIESAVVENPYRERLTGLLMTSLYRSGRQAEALRSYTRLRDRLREELGIDPSPELQQLELKILDQDPELDAPSQRDLGPTRPAARGYELHEVVDTSRLGLTYRGFQSAIGREVGVLVIDSTVASSAQFVRRFHSELQLASALEHPHLVPIFDFWRDPNEACVVGPHYRGGSLAAHDAERRWPLLDVARVGDHVASALGYLHRNDYPHGGVTAHSVYLDDDGNAYLANVGLIRLLPDTPLPTAKSDVFDLGRLLFELLTARKPDEGTLGAFRNDLPTALGHVLARAMHPDPESRFQRVEDLARAVKQTAGLDVSPIPTERLSPGEKRNPYKGLRAFQETDATDFHGRRALIEEMVGVLSDTRMLTVVGPSGSGKSSTVRAGLLPAVRNGVIPGSDSWAVTDMFPGVHPFEELESALLRIATNRPGDLGQVLAHDPEGLVRIVPELTESVDDTLVVIDQFEELFSQSSSQDRKRFLTMLATAATHPDSSIRLVLTLRADFFDQPLEYPEFAAVMRENIVTVSPPSSEGLASAIAQPALDAGIGLEPGLVPRVLDDVHREPGGLPLLQYAMTELFDSRDGDVLTIEEYERIGGVGGAVAKRAEEIYAGLASEGRSFARQLFLRLVAVEEHAEDTRRRIRQSEVSRLGFAEAVVRSVVERFGAFRLLSFDRDVVSRTPTIELAHEALLREWDRLNSWIDERREDLLIHRRLQVTARDWEESDADPSYLMRGTRLDQAQSFLETTDISIAEDESAFIEASIAQQELEQAGIEALETKAARRRRFAVGVLAGAAVIASVLGIYAFAQRGEAIDNAALAASNELAAVSRGLAEDDPELGVLLALEAIERAKHAGLQPSPEALSALWHAYSLQRVELLIEGAGEEISAFSPSGAILATDLLTDQQAVALWDPQTGEQRALLEAPHLADTPDGYVSEILFSPDGGLIFVARGYGSDAPETVVAVDVYDALTFERTTFLEGPRGRYSTLDVSGDGYLIASSNDPVVTAVWDMGAGGAPIEAFEDLYGHGLLSDDTLIATEPESPTDLVLVDRQSGDHLGSFPTALTVSAAVVSPARDLVAVTDGDRVAIHDVKSGKATLGPFALPTNKITWSPDGTRLALSGNTADISIVDSFTGEQVMVLSGHDSSVYSTAWHPAGDRLAAVGYGVAETRIWNVDRRGPPALGNISVEGGWGLLDPIPVGTGFLRSVPRSRVDVLELSGDVRASFDFFPLFPALGVISGNGEWVGGHYTTEIEDSADAEPSIVDGEGAIIEIETDRRIDLPACTSPRGLSWNGSLAAIDTWFPTKSWVSCMGQTVTGGVIDVSSGEYQIEVDHDELLAATFGTGEANDREYVAMVLTDDPIGSSPLSTVEVWSLDPVTRLVSIPDSNVDGQLFLLPRFSQDGRYLGIGAQGGRALVVDMQLLREGASADEYILFNREVHDGSTVRAIPDRSGLLVTMGHDQFYRFWDIESGDFLMEIDVRGKIDILSHGFSPDGETLYYMAEHELISQIPTDPDAMIERVRAALTRDLTEDECRQYLGTDGCDPNA